MRSVNKVTLLALEKCQLWYFSELMNGLLDFIAMQFDKDGQGNSALGRARACKAIYFVCAPSWQEISTDFKCST